MPQELLTHADAGPLRLLPPEPPRRAHLVGAAGSGMRSLAAVLSGWGWFLSGSDQSAAPVPLAGGATMQPIAGHDAENLPRDAELLVHSDAVAPDNPELRRAAELGIPTASYFQMLGRLMQGRRGLAVAGTHGKSTTTAMTAAILTAAGLDPTVVYGADPIDPAAGSRAGRGPWMLAEACEYRANFLRLRPQAAVLTGIEPDHFDYYPSAVALEAAFARFVGLLPDDGLLLAAADCPAVHRVAVDATCRLETFGFEPTCDWQARQLIQQRGTYQFDLCHLGRPLCPVRLRVPGRHNVANALAAAALAAHCGVAPEAIAAGLGRFRGLRRRLQRTGAWRGVALLDDYAHHPTELAATLSTVRQIYPGRRIWCVFQPHQASRTQNLLDELAQSLQNVDVAVVADIFRAREPAPRPGEVTAADLADRVRAAGCHVPEVHAPGEIVRLLENRLRPGDVLLTVGAGDIRKIADELVDRTGKNRAAG